MSSYWANHYLKEKHAAPQFKKEIAPHNKTQFICFFFLLSIWFGFWNQLLDHLQVFNFSANASCWLLSWVHTNLSLNYPLFSIMYFSLKLSKTLDRFFNNRSSHTYTTVKKKLSYQANAVFQKLQVYTKSNGEAFTRMASTFTNIFSLSGSINLITYVHYFKSFKQGDTN